MHPIPSRWSDHELDVAILQLCVEFPDAPMIAYSRALERCRRHPPGSPHDLLLDAMRIGLQEELSCLPPPAHRRRLGTS